MSGSVFLNNLDDFIAPSQACVNPTVAAKLTTANPPTSSSGKPGKVTLMADYSTTDYEDYAKPVVQPNLIKTKVASTGSNQTVASVSLNDCLACSGCVTSAEAVLIAEQSNQKFLSKLNSVNETNEIIAVQISPNSRASIADFLGLSPIDTFLLISAALKANGVKYVLDSAAGADAYLVEAREEFLRRLKEGKSKDWVKPTVTTANSSSSINVYSPGAPAGTLPTEQVVSSFAQNHNLPMFTSHCPGWVCYAEKTSPQALPYLSTVKSAQQIIGTVMKSLRLSGENAQNIELRNLGDANIFMVSIQPCFDKKLEASRRDFYHSSGNITEVDLVLSTTELWEILVGFAQTWQQKEVGTGSMTAMDVDLDDNDGVSSSLSTLTVQKQLLRKHFQFVLDYLMLTQQQRAETIMGSDPIEALFRQGSMQATHLLSAAEKQAGSGAVAEYLFRYTAERVYGINLWSVKDLTYKAGRNADYMELDLAAYMTPEQIQSAADRGFTRPLKFARAYGFRNIQSLLLKMKRGQVDVDLIEMMACPSGCNNGGGQLKNFAQLMSSGETDQRKPLPETIAESKERVAGVEDTFHRHLQLQQPDENVLVQFLYAPERLQAPGSEAAVSLLHTRFHAVPELETIAPLAVKW